MENRMENRMKSALSYVMGFALVLVLFVFGLVAAGSAFGSQGVAEKEVDEFSSYPSDVGDMDLKNFIIVAERICDSFLVEDGNVTVTKYEGTMHQRMMKIQGNEDPILLLTKTPVSVFIAIKTVAGKLRSLYILDEENDTWTRTTVGELNKLHKGRAMNSASCTVVTHRQ